MTDLLVDPDADVHLDDYVPAPDPDPTPEPAPYGTNKDGSPRRRPGPAKKTTAKKSTSTRASTRPTSSSPTRPSSPPRKSLPPLAAPPSGIAPTRADYTEGLRGWLQLPQIALSGVAMMTQSRPLLADAAVVGMLAEPLVELGADLAVKYQGTAAVEVLDRLIIAGPFAALGMAMVTGVAQIMANHKKIDHTSLAGKLLGVRDPDELADAMASQLVDAARQQTAAA